MNFSDFLLSIDSRFPKIGFYLETFNLLILYDLHRGMIFIYYLDSLWFILFILNINKILS